MASCLWRQRPPSSPAASPSLLPPLLSTATGAVRPAAAASHGAYPTPIFRTSKTSINQKPMTMSYYCETVDKWELGNTLKLRNGTSSSFQLLWLQYATTTELFEDLSVQISWLLNTERKTYAKITLSNIYLSQWLPLVLENGFTDKDTLMCCFYTFTFARSFGNQAMWSFLQFFSPPPAFLSCFFFFFSELMFVFRCNLACLIQLHFLLSYSRNWPWRSKC